MCCVDAALGTGISVVNPQSATMATSAGATVSYSLRGALVRGPMQGGGGSGVPRVPHVRGWLKQWARNHGRGADVDAIEQWQREQQQLVTQLLGLAGQEAAEAESEAEAEGANPVEDH